MLRRTSTDSDRQFAVPLVAHIALILVVAVVLAVGFGFGLWWIVGQPNITNGKHWTPKETFDFVKIVLAVVGGVGAVVALVVSYRKQRLGETAESREDARLFGEDFSRATEQISSEQPPVRLAGMYTLERLAASSPTQQQTIVNVICAYLRMQDESTEADVPDGFEKNREKITHEDEVRLTAQRILTNNLRPSRGSPDSASAPWKKIHLDLSGAVLVDFELKACRLDGARFEKTQFRGATRFNTSVFNGDALFDGAVFSGDVSFDGAVFNGEIRFNSAEFTGKTQFDRARFRGEVQFDGAAFAKEVKFSGAFFLWEARFHRTEFREKAYFSEVNFAETAGFDKAQFGEAAWFDEVNSQGATRFVDTEFWGVVEFGGETKFRSQARFDNSWFLRDVSFTMARFNANARFNRAEFRGAAEFSGARFEMQAWFRHARFHQNAIFVETRFFSSARFAQAHFGWKVRFDGSKFSRLPALELIGARVLLDVPSEVLNQRRWPRGWEIINPASPKDMRLPGRRGRWARLKPC